jgi:hypothetical protein
LSQKASQSRQSVEAQREALASIFLPPCEALYVETGNEVHAWRGYRIARRLKVPVPEWIFAAFDQIAARAGVPMRSRGGPSALSRAKHDLRDLRIVRKIDILTNAGSLSVDEAIERVIEELSDRTDLELSFERVREIYYTRFPRT